MNLRDMEETEGFYRTLCSLETLRSGAKGFFHDFSESARQAAGEQWLTKVFGRLINDEQRIRTIFTDTKVAGTVLETLNRTEVLYRGKDATASRARRLEGFQAAAAGERRKALLLFSQAVLRAPLPGKCKNIDKGFSLTLAFLARAEIFLALNEHTLALEDLSFAEETDLTLPDALRVELARLKEACEKSRANEKSLVPLPERRAAGSENKRLSGGENPQLPSASALLKIEETETAGKRAIAADCIDPGDRLVVEPPYAATLLPEFFGTHCHHCFDRFKAPVGCPDCSSVAFCNRKCRDTAVASYHKYECKILALLIGSGMSVLSMLALRMATQCQVDKCLKISNALNPCKALKNEDQSLCQSKLSKSAKRRSRKKKLQESRREQDQNEKVEEDEIDMKVYDLVSHEKRRTAADFFERSLMAAFLLKCLQRVGFFESPTRDDEIPNEEEIAIGGLLLRHLQLLQFNAHEVFETRFGAEHRFRGSRPNYIGVAIYPTVARFNHDCYPAVTRYFIGRSIVIRATRSLQPGDVVAENYGPIFTKRSLEERRKTLTGRYWFYCECKACRENWPRFEALTNDHVRLRCPTEGCSKFHRKPRDPNKPIECPSCRRKVELRDPVERVRECEESYARGFAAMEEEKPEKALEIFFEALKRFHSVAVPPHKDTHLAEIAASACMADEGNVYRIESL
ncbi:SET and MYND domain-containing protein 4-like isoform X1 [Ceratina calcarata]|uniref:SET and MYND domain-containing protein 4-like isoform X1 n=1 Tax=Ceratina calcarata TaxID=156304 RepID=A0AAJ7IV05_9HYME|nr:SET and MYND domain-containing protein 4-like isoform X1 [Ceratina calcarata]XP_017877201.1 SET and MYND domain-containing protein 4-like isoform X1 [Ceratina calcarata]